MIRHFLIFTALSSATTVHSTTRDFSLENSITNPNSVENKVIYGVDNRKDLYEISQPQVREQARSTAALISNSRLSENGGGFIDISSQDFGEAYGLCSSERFREQPSAAFCSGFLIGEDLLVIAGHCLRTEVQCKNTGFVFDFALFFPNERPNLA